MNTSPYIIEIIIALFCFYMLRHSVQIYRKAKQSARWPTTQGRLVEIKLWGTRNIDGKMVEAEKLSVKYEYEVEQKQYTGADLAFYTLHYPETTEFYAEHQQGHPVMVYYHPTKPRQSVLISGLHPTKPYSGLVLGFIALMVGVLVPTVSLLGGFD